MDKIARIQELTKVGEMLSYYRYDNGYVVEIDGDDKEDEYKTLKLLCATLDDVFDVLREVDKLPLRR